MDELNWFHNLFTKPIAKPQKNVMNVKNKSQPADYHTKSRAAIKTMHLQVAVEEPDLKNAVLAAFDLAKSGGRELNLDFNLPSLIQNIPKSSRIRAVQLVSSRAGG